MNENVTISPDYVPPALFALNYPGRGVVHAATTEEETLCNVTTWGQMDRYDDPPAELRLCNNCSLILRRGTYHNSAWAQRWLERRRVEERG